MKTRSYSQPDLAKLAVKMIIINELSALTDSTKKISGKSRYTYEVVQLNNNYSKDILGIKLSLIKCVGFFCDLQ